MKYSPRIIWAFIVLGGSLLFFPFLGSVHLFDWDEINFAECAREMIVGHQYSTPTIDFLPFHEKPPLFIWMQVLSMKIFGVNEFAARFPNAVCGLVTLSVVFYIGRKLKGTRLGLLWAGAFAGSFLPHFYFMSGIIDPWFNLFVFLGIYFFILYSWNVKQKPEGTGNRPFLIASAGFIGLAMLTKGPVALLVFMLCVAVYWMASRFKRILTAGQGLLFLTVVLITGGSWYFYQLLANGALVGDFIRYQFQLLLTEDGGHGGPVYYHALVLLFGCFPASVVALASFRRSLSDNPFQSYVKSWMFILFFVVLILFSLVKTKIIHYSSLCYFPITFLSAYSAEKFISGEWKWKKRMSWITGITGSVMGLIFILLPLAATYKQKIISSGLIHDAFALENLKAEVRWTGAEAIPGILFVSGIVLTLVLLAKTKRIALPALFVLSMLTLSAVSLLIVPKVEEYSQGAAIEFYETLRGKSCDLETLEFKSYAHLFYSGKTPGCPGMRGERNRDSYYVTRIDKTREVLEKYPYLQELYRKNGFVFYKLESRPDYFTAR